MKGAAGSWLSRLLGRRRATSADLGKARLDAWMREGFEHQQNGRLPEAGRLYRRILKADPRYADAAYFLGTLADGEGRGEEALSLYRDAAQAKPDEPTFLFALGNRYYRARRFDEAVQVLARGLALQPDDVDGRNDFGMSLMELGRWEEGIAAIEPLVASHPDLFEARHNLGTAYRQLGRIDDAIAQYRRALELRPDHLNTANCLLFTLNYSDKYAAAAIAAEHRAFGIRHARPVSPPAAEARWPRRLRIGYLSPDFRIHAVASFITPVLTEHDRGRFEIFCFYTHAGHDSETARLRSLAEHWADCGALTDAAIAELIRGHRIDILVDLAGHTSGHRIEVLATKPAPIQITYLGYPNTTGLPTVDYRITDAVADPPGAADELNVEKLLRLRPPFLCYRAGPGAPEPGPLPALRNGHVTFGCFNNILKLSDSFIDVAARVMIAVPGSRLVLKGGPLASQMVVARLRQRFFGAGVAPERLDLREWTATFEDHLGAYREIDIALDSFPYNGTTTTCEALWMGVPVVTLRGDRHAGRVGASLLGSMGLTEHIAGDAEEYVRICTRLAGDADALAALRAGLRGQMRASPLVDEVGFTRELERCYQSIWLEHMRPLPDEKQ